MSFDDIPEDSQESFLCECGGNILHSEMVWECDECGKEFMEGAGDE